MKKRQTLSSEQMSAVDTYCAEHLGMPGIVLMENAGRAVAYAARQLMLQKDKKVTIVCGMGNNGGDGLCAARHLIDHCSQVDIFLTKDPSALKGDPAINYTILQRLDHRVQILTGADDQAFISRLHHADLIIDALLGFGLKGEVRQPVSSIIDVINRSRKPVLSVDIPSGLCANTGKVLGRAIKASSTVTFGRAKVGLLTGAGPLYTGTLTIDPIGIPEIVYSLL